LNAQDRLLGLLAEVSHSFTGGLDEFREEQGEKGHKIPD
jgi:hypothetical protein